MGNIENYNIGEIELEYDSKNHDMLHKLRIEHKILGKSTILEAYSIWDLKEKQDNYIQMYDKVYADKYNSDLAKIYNNIYRSKIKTINWDKEKNLKRIPWKRVSNIIEYTQFGKPKSYYCLNNLEKQTNKPFGFSQSLFLLFNKNKMSIEDIENERRYKLYIEEQNNWHSDYINYIDEIKHMYYNHDSLAIVAYSKIVLKNIDFHDKINDFFEKSEPKIIFDINKKKLVVDFILPSKDNIFYLFGDMIYHKEQNKYFKTWVDEKEIIRRLEFIWKQIIFIYVHTLFQTDEINAIKIIYFNAKLSNETKYLFEMIIEKDKMYINKSMKVISIDNFFDTFRRDAVLLRKLRLEKIDPSHIKKNNDENIVSLIITRQKLNKKAIEYITSFKYLKELYLVENELIHIPRSILNLSKLEVLRIAHNEISEIPFCLENLNRLHTLKLDHNLIDNIDKKLLECFLEMPTLKTFLLNNNPLIDEDMSYLEKDDLISKLLVVPHKISKEKKILKTKIPLIITEGKTDWKHLKKALERFQERGEYLDLDIEFKEFEDISMSDSELDDYAQSHAKKINKRRIICIFDRDLPKRVEEYGKNDFVHVANKQYINTLKEKCKEEYGVASKKYLELKNKLDTYKYQEIDTEVRGILKGKEHKEWETLLKNNVYAFCIPKLSDELDEICIEFYYKEKDLKTEDVNGKRLFIADEFEFKEKVNNCNTYISKCGKFKTDKQSGNDKNTKHITLQYPNDKGRGYVYKIEEEECNKSNHVNLSKNDFAKNIYNDVEGFDNFDIENFRLIFDVIERIINDT